MRVILLLGALAFVLIVVAFFTIPPLLEREPERLKAVDLNYVMLPMAAGTAIEEIAKEYEEANPEYSVRIKAQSPKKHLEELGPNLWDGDAPDIFHVPAGQTLRSMAAEGYLRDVFDAEGAELAGRIYRAALALGQVDGTTAAIPLEVSFSALWYDRTVFEAHGLTPPADWQAFLDVCRKLREAGLVPLAQGAKERVDVMPLFSYLVVRSGLVPRVMEGLFGYEEPAFDDESFQEVWGRMGELADAGAFPEGMAELSSADAQAMFIDGRAAMVLATTNTPVVCARSNMDKLGNLRCFAFPVLPGSEAGDVTALIGGSGCLLAVWSGSPYVSESLALLGDLAGQRVADGLVRGGLLPALHPPHWDHSSVPEAVNSAVSLLEGSSAVLPYLAADLPPRIVTAMADASIGVLTGSATPREAAEAVQAVAEEMLYQRIHSPGAPTIRR